MNNQVVGSIICVVIAVIIYFILGDKEEKNK